MFDIIISLSKNKLNDNECKEIAEYLIKEKNWEILIGQLIFHKLLCRSYIHFIEQNWVELIPFPVIQLLKCQFKVNEYKNKLRKSNIENLLDELNSSQIKYCIIKGVALENDLFKDSIREFNDTDLLINFDNFKMVDKILLGLGYKRGIYNAKKNRIDTNRYDDIFYIVNTHQTLNYLKILDDSFFKLDILDLQFEFTLQKKYNYDIDMKILLNNRINFNIFDKTCYTLSPFDNFLMICTHIYGEAILIQEIKKYKDLQLIKFSDVYEWIKKYYNVFDWEEKINYINKHGFLQPVLYCMYFLSEVYKCPRSINILNILKKSKGYDLNFIDEYRDDSFNIKRWKETLKKRVFRTDKNSML